MEPLLHLRYSIDRELLLKEADSLKNTATSYQDSRYPGMSLGGWLIRHYEGDYAKKVMDDFGVVGKPRFYWLAPYATIPEHVDNGTLCGLNFILTEHASPIMFSGKPYYYESILVNTTLPHSVVNNEHERIMFKISIFNETFEQVAEKIKRYLI